MSQSPPPSPPTAPLTTLSPPLSAPMSKIVIAGSTGFIGSEFLSQILEKKSVTSIILLSRRPLPEAEKRDSRIKVLVLKDFLVYGEELRSELEGTAGVMWALGGSNSNPTPSEKMDEVEIQYPLALANFLISTHNSSTATPCPKIRFLFISGSMSERNQTAKLLFLSQGRKARGQAENLLLSLSQQHPDVLETVIVKCGMVLPKTSKVPEFVVGVSRSAIRVDELGGAMVELVLGCEDEKGEGKEGGMTVGNMRLREMGKRVLKERSKEIEGK